MASGNFEFTASGYLQGKITWTATSNGSAANTSTVTAILYAHRTNNYTTTGRSWSGYVKVGSAQVNINFSSSVSVGSGWVEMARVTTTVAHNNDGSGSVYISGSVTGPSGTAAAGWTSSGGQTVTLDKIARYTSITSFTVSKRSETTLTFNWKTADTIDYLWFSNNNGASWNGYDTADGTSGSFTSSGLSPNTTYNCKIRVRRKDSQLTTDSSTVSQTTYKVPTQSLKSKTETNITMNWSVDSTANYIWYSKDNGLNWIEVGAVNATSGSYTIKGLSTNTTYNIKTRVRRSAASTTYDTTTLAVTTYNYPYCTESPNFTVGNNVTLKFYNPLNRTFNFTIIGNGSNIYTWENITGTSWTGAGGTTAVNALYASIPNATSGKYQVKVVYSSSTKFRNNGNFYSINTSQCNPTFSSFTYQDTNSSTVALTGNNQILVNGYSNVTATISTANKAVAKNSATMKTYKMTIGNQSTNLVNYSSSANVDLSLSKVTSGTITVYATDSRGLSTSVNKTATIKNYSNLVIKSVTAVRGSNGVGQDVTLSFNGTYWNGNFGSVINSITRIGYYYKETTSSQWIAGETELSVTTSGANWSGSASIKGDLGANGFDVSKSYDIRLQVSDALQYIKTYDIVLGSGTPAIAIYQNKVAIGQKYNSSIGGDLQAGDMDIVKELKKHIIFKKNHGYTSSGLYYLLGTLSKPPSSNENGAYISIRGTIGTWTRYALVDIVISNRDSLRVSGSFKGLPVSFGNNKIQIYQQSDNTHKIYLYLSNYYGGTDLELSSDDANIYNDSTLSTTPTGTLVKTLDSTTLISDNYSTTETRIGTWIDGKPIYRKVFTGSDYSEGSVSYYKTFDFTPDILVNAYGTIKSSSGTLRIGDIVWDGDRTTLYTSRIEITGNTNKLQILWTKNLSVTSYQFTIEYTKTTD